MPCYHPLTAYFGKEVGRSGKRGLVFSHGASFSGVPLKLPCGQCIGCRLERSRQWAMRCMHERRLHRDNVFVTLTYDDEHIPYGGTLVKRDLQLFMKRLRKEYGNGIRFYGCGEYGAVSNRPHYHLILFGVDFPDKRYYKLAPRGERLYSSEALGRLWSSGFNVIGDVTFDSCAYVARYVCDKITGDRAGEHYRKVTAYGEIIDLVPEFTVMSRRPGLGAGWFDKYGAETYAHDSCVMNGREVRPPRFYDVRQEALDMKRMGVLKRKRRREALKYAADNTPERRRVRERVTELNLARNRRDEI